MEGGLIDGLRGNKQLILDGYVYSRRRTSSVSVFWCCAQRGKFKCDGRVTTCNNELFTEPRNFHGHSHPPNEFHKEVTEARRNLREACQSPEARPLQVLCTALHDMSDGAKASMGKLASVQRDLRLHRQQVFPPVPQKVEDLEIPNEWKSTGGAEEKQFLFFDNGKVTDRILIFGTDECLNVLGRSDTWFMDGTFNVTTKLLMANPKRVMLDFEIGAMNAVRMVFQHVEVKTSDKTLQAQSAWFEVCTT